MAVAYSSGGLVVWGTQQVTDSLVVDESPYALLVVHFDGWILMFIWQAYTDCVC